ncbi:MAG: transcriptional regulator [Chloroflexi bacterium]|nr:transcriptional regulator [Chloroflexota bacterium]
MTILPIRTEEDYETALKEIEALWDAASGTPEADRLDVLVTLVEAYEDEHYPIPAPDPIELIRHVMEARELTVHDMESFLGPEPVVTEVLNRQRPLTLEMISKLHMGLDLSGDILIRPYPLHRQIEPVQ